MVLVLNLVKLVLRVHRYVCMYMYICVYIYIYTSTYVNVHM